MKPNFALSLSFEGIGLLHRSFPGWHRVGEVALDSSDLAGELEVLRETAQQINGQVLTSKVVIPNEQIKYLSLELTLADEEQRTEAVLKALEGATPYPVDQLVYDWSADGDITQIAAVAKETLVEAEDFACDHGFGPVCFVAIPPTDQFSGEPFFGPTDFAKTLLSEGSEVQRDMAPIRVTGIVRLPDPGDAISVEEVPESTPAIIKKTSKDIPTEAELELSPSAVENSNLVTEQSSAIEFENLSVAEEDQSDDPGEIVASVLSDTLPSIEDDETPEQATKELSLETVEHDFFNESEPRNVSDDETVENEKTDAGEVLGFSTIRTPRDDDPDVVVPSLSGVRRTHEECNDEALNFQSLSQGQTDAPAIKTIPGNIELQNNYEEDSVSISDHYTNPVASGKASAIAASQSDARDGGISFFSRRGTELAFGLTGTLRKSLSNRTSRRAEEKFSKIPQVDPTTANAGDLESERRRLTVFGARKPETENQIIGGKPRYLGLVLTAILLVFLAGVAAWASIFLDDGFARLFGPRDPEVATLAPGTLDEFSVEGEEAMVPEAPQDGVESVSLELPTERTVYAPLSQPNLPHALTEREAQARYAVTGVWQRAPQEPQLPDQLSIQNLYLTSIDPRVDAEDAVALPALSALTTDLALGRIALPAKRGTRFELDDRGLVIASAEGTTSPEGFLVFSGRPSSTPAAFPRREDADETSASVEKSKLARFRPHARPSELVSQNERANLGGLTRDELASKKPRIRPLSAQQLAQATREREASEAAKKAAVESALVEAVASTTSLDTATEQAVAQSRKPKSRPQNFARLVDRARKAQKSTANQTVTNVAAAVPQQQKTAPKIPSKSSVAKAATVRNQLNLRKINLIGVYGKPSSRRALIRLSNGRYKKVKVGDRLDGGQISSIGDGELRYQKRGRSVILKMPRG